MQNHLSVRSSWPVNPWLFMASVIRFPLRQVFPSPKNHVLKVRTPCILIWGLFLGPALPQDCAYPSMTSSPDGKGVVLFGCVENAQVTDTIFKMTSINGRLTWEKMSQKLQHPRMNSVGMLIPNEFVRCFKN